MQRRTLLKAAAVSGLLGTSKRQLFGLAGQKVETAEHVNTVLFVAKCHLDVGFTSTQSKVIRKYFEVYYPQAMRTATDVRNAGADRYTWTTGSWLLYEYLEQASTVQRRAMEQAVVNRDIAYHALPFSWQTEMLDRSMIDGALGFAHSLDRRFGIKTIGAKMTDVPGHSRGIVAPLSDAGIRLLDIGVNAASTPPDVPDLFLWQDPSGKTLAVMYHRHDYGSVLTIPGTTIAVDVEVRGDNSGPHTPAEIAEIYGRLRAQFPHAVVKPATMNDVAEAVDKVRKHLPIIFNEIGDTWIYGCASDPYKVARYRSMARQRKAWIEQGQFAVGDQTDRQLLRHLLLASEHTWGTDTKSYLDDDHYRPASLATVLNEPGHVVMETSWKEKRDSIDAGVAALPPALAQQAKDELGRLTASAPDLSGMKQESASIFETRHFLCGIDPTTGAIIKLRNKTASREWASPQNPLALFTYQTLSAQQYAGFLARYLTVETDWGPKDFGKPGIAAFGAIARDWHPRLLRSFTASSPTEDRIVLELGFMPAGADAIENVAWPKQIFLALRFPAHQASIELHVSTLGKLPNRMPEAMWLTFSPLGVEPGSWRIEKVNQMVAAKNVVRGGNRSMHAVNDLVECATADKTTFKLRTLDAAVVAFGERSPLNFSLEGPDFTRGAHISLFNNAWGTNYPQWCGGDWNYRFHLFP